VPLIHTRRNLGYILTANPQTEAADENGLSKTVGKSAI